MPLGTGVFATLPENFFSPLARVNREHYANLLLIYYRLFQENARGIEREQVVRSFTDYLGLHRNTLADESPDAGDNTDSPDEAVLPEAELLTPELDFENREENKESTEHPAKSPFLNDRALASRFLRKLINAGWLDEEILADYTKVINITPHGRPFLEALAKVDEGLKNEYESHVVAIYSLLCTDAITDNGHYAVRNAYVHTQALIDSLKVLSQSIKGYYDRISTDAAQFGISGILRLQYDEYAPQILDAAYKRLKTSDNLSRYRPKILEQVGDLLRNNAWLDTSARKLAVMKAQTQFECKRQLEDMLNEIRDTLNAVDPLLREIDHRNSLYSRSSTERIKVLLEPDSTIAGKIAALVKEIHVGNKGLYHRLAHRLHRIRAFAPESLYKRQKKEAPDFMQAVAPADRAALERDKELFMNRLLNQLGIKRISAWLDEHGGQERLLSSKDLVYDEASFVRFIYSVLYADSRQTFDYGIEDKPEYESIDAAGYGVPDLLLRKK
ncbi:Wadjet anti-phage system protein JetA family protein [Leadbettera azotonutricia]|uniref:Uncharacterized protein n=1 Tax=Leadbettera azotonutricia (strain ATCC BAA-888 / DSM 13862 / ZAS-9) TaxID=545695 RepID=F5YBE9_LEAAZ|nr:Wadjet anti-phage system protein JetA family protein [Leadbettera azotonutricia]AEF82984.1 conserved hypothetical protein [Leadbettera azotonutricia ZAS-9]